MFKRMVANPACILILGASVGWLTAHARWSPQLLAQDVPTRSNPTTGEARSGPGVNQVALLAPDTAART